MQTGALRIMLDLLAILDNVCFVSNIGACFNGLFTHCSSSISKIVRDRCLDPKRPFPVDLPPPGPRHRTGPVSPPTPSRRRCGLTLKSLS